MKELLVIQQELKAPKNQRNNFGKYNYRSLEDILESVKPILAKEKCILTLSDIIENIGTKNYLKATAILYSNDGKEIASNSAYAREAENQKGMNDSQLTGSTSSYARKYALNGLFAIDDNKDSDATNTHGARTSPPQQTKRRDYTLEASKCKNLAELKNWFLGLSKEEQKLATKVKDNRKEELSETIDYRFTIPNAKDGKEMQRLSKELGKDRAKLKDYPDIIKLYNEKCEELGLNELTKLPF